MKSEGTTDELLIAVGKKPKGDAPAEDPETPDEENGEREASKGFLALCRGSSPEDISDEDADALVVSYEALRRACS